MSLRFSTEGPVFPEQLVDALLTGEVVFLCGAGVSAPQLPGFKDLVDQCFAGLGMEKSASEEQSFKDGRFEEVLGSLSRRIVNPADMNQRVVELLKPREQADLAHHRTILRLSRNLENRPVIVTTNFDTMLEKALLELESPELVRQLSFAGQDLPTPGSASFGGIIHLHGRIADEQIDLEETPLVVTSADYGDAYMRSGWASRFLFDLCRCKTIVLIGYSAGDAPVRYFLNVLEADRQRFPDLRPVYALDSVSGRDEPDVRWSALAVQPIVYEVIINPTTDERDYSALWRDLDLLADVVERPRITRRTWAQEILGKPFASALPEELDRILWLLRGSRDLWPVVINAIEDVHWLDFFDQRKVWNDQDSTWIFAAWLARDLQSVERFSIAISWLERLGKPFAEAVGERVWQARNLPDLWLRAWRVLSTSLPKCDRRFHEQPFAVQQRLRSKVVLNADLHKAIELLLPTPKLTSRNFPVSSSPTRLSDLISVRWPVESQGEAIDLIEALVAVQKPNLIMPIATVKLQEIVAMSVDIDCVDDDFDSNDFAVPSIEPHAQNEYREGLIFLIQLLARLLPEAAKLDRTPTRALAESWKGFSGFLGVRLWMHALRNSTLFTAEEAINGIQNLPRNIFWHVQRELALVLLDRAGDAEPELVVRVEQRICSEADAYFARYTIDKGQVDWRDRARDTEVWLRLSMLDAAGSLSQMGKAELTAIKSRRKYLDREVEDRDFFRSYSSGVQMVIGDAQPIIDAADDERLEIARSVKESPDIRKQLGWSVYCRTDPRGAVDTLSRAPLDSSNATLWGDLISSLSFRQDESDSTTRELVVRVFTILEPATDSFLAPIISRLADLYFSAPRKIVPRITTWWTRLLDIAVAHDSATLDGSRDLFEDAINSPAGRLTEALLFDVNQSRQTGVTIDRSLLNAITHASKAGGRQGIFARAILVRDAAFVLSIEGQSVAGVLEAALDGPSIEAISLRGVLVHQSGLSAAVSAAFSRHILCGVLEVESRGRSSRNAAAKILAPALAIIRKEPHADRWGISIEQTAVSLRSGPPELRESAATVLKHWPSQIDAGPEEVWRNAIGPLFTRVWPRDRVLCEKQLTIHFAELAIASGDAFPESLMLLLPYLSRLDGYVSIHTIDKSKIPEKFPRETLILLWRLFGPGCTGDLHGVPKILERMIKADKGIELDRRLQWLDQRALRYD